MDDTQIKVELMSFATFRWEQTLDGFVLGSKPDLGTHEPGHPPIGQLILWKRTGKRAWLTSGEPPVEIENRRQLRKAVLEWLAGPRPVHLPPGYICYAKHNHNRFGDSYIWVLRRQASRKETAEGSSIKTDTDSGD